jgi:hypothetical protein
VTKVLSIYGGPVGEHEVNETCVEQIEEWLEMAKSGQIVGICLVGLGYDNLAQYTIAGKIGGYGLVGATHMVLQELTHAIMSEE